MTGGLLAEGLLDEVQSMPESSSMVGVTSYGSMVR